MSIINIEKERKKEEKNRQKIRKNIENAPTDNEYEDYEDVSTNILNVGEK